MRVHNAAQKRPSYRFQALDVLTLPQARTTDHAALAADVLRQRINDKVGSKFERRLVDGRRERVVHDKERAMPIGSERVAEANAQCDIDLLIERIRRSLDKDASDTFPRMLPRKPGDFLQNFFVRFLRRKLRG